MKLQDVKERIDNFFDNITAEKLYEISVLKYNFSEIIIDIENNHFETSKVSYYPSATPVFDNDKDEVSGTLALAS